MFIEPVAWFRSPFKTKFGIPRQAGLVPELKGRIVFEPRFRSADAVRGLEGFEYIWLICGNERIGVFSSRSPFRPNGLGLSSVRIESIEYDAKDSDGKPIGPVINVLGADLMDGTPIYDIKPYVTYADSHPDAVSGFVDDKEWRPLKVVFADEVTEPVEVTIPGWTKAAVAALKEVLAQDPRPRYQNDPDKVYGMIFNDMDVRFKVDGDVLTVVGIKHPKAEA